MPRGPFETGGSSSWALGRTLSPEETWLRKTGAGNSFPVFITVVGQGLPTSPSVHIVLSTSFRLSMLKLEIGLQKVSRTLHSVQFIMAKCKARGRPFHSSH